jgi:hypothetical protein
MPAMSYDLAVWVGPRPANAEAADAEFARRMDAMEEQIGSDAELAPAPELMAFVEAALARYPELDENSGPECPWASGPLSGEIVGDLIYFPMTFSGAEYARDVLAELVASRALVCYDPQIEALLPNSSSVPASVISERAYAALDAHLVQGTQQASRGGWFRRLFGSRSDR